MIRIAACDDNELLLGILKDQLTDYAQNSAREIAVFTFASAEALLADVKAADGYDVYVLDIVMPGISGMEAAVSLRSSGDKGRIIFLSASMEYAVKSYDVDAFYYLTKPVDVAKLYSVLDRACQDVAGPREETALEVKTAAGLRLVRREEVAYLDIQDRAVCWHLKNGETVTGRKLRGSFSEEIAALLEDRRFALCGSGLAVNLNCVETIDDNALLLKGGIMLYPSRSACAALKKLVAGERRPRR